MWNNFKNYLSHSKIFVKEIVLLSLVFLLSASFFFHYPIHKIISLLFLTFVIDIVFLYSLGKKRALEIDEIKTTIKNIRKNKYNSPNEIQMSKSLVDLEGNIKAMFKRTQRDITQMQKLEQTRKEFLGNVSHELRTPIFALQGFLETLLNGALYDEKVNKQFLEKAYRHSENLNALLNDLIDISMIESGQMRMSFRYFNLNNFLNEIYQQVKEPAERKNIQFILNKLDPDLDVYGDKDRLTQVMNNLLSNAIKYTEKGRVELIVEEKQKSVWIKVKDTGVGIPQEDLNRVFERFYRTDRDRSKTIPGTGLGLAIVKHIIEAHDSKIEVVSDKDVGSEFSFKLKKHKD
ncbi:alkaline phosphatase synthesis sensor protein PhoR [bacterium BMS3Abin04]|nr:alkaline phosphatase synthesis sensor protein PhoR [bacterium BMS3Abin04]